MPSSDDETPRPNPAGPAAPEDAPTGAVGRRTFLGASLAAVPAAAALTDAWRVGAGEPSALGATSLDVAFEVNGQPRRLTVDARTTLLDALREHLSLTGAKKGCDQGQCGACTVLVGDRRVLSCLTLAASVSGERIVSIEGLAQGGELHPMQAAFIKHDGLQCGFCTPGQILSAVGLLAEGCPADRGAIRECMSGNICRCGAYPGIVDAILEARGRHA
jgi:xanthine dehydrogenase YagT iron-sulfur-binding subunit